jgi:ubiquinone/menaquinone biosynthesis C-methylase UbiE
MDEAMDYDRTNIPATYKRGRDHGPAVLEKWMRVVAARVAPTRVQDILDLGCGTGRFSNGLAVRFNASVTGIDPSIKMLRQAMDAPASPLVSYAMGLAEALPLSANSMDLIFMSMVFHHFTDHQGVAKECARVLRPGGRLCLRTASVEQIAMYPYVPFFPESRPLLEQRLPSLGFQRDAFEAAGLRTLSCELVTQEIAADLWVYAEKLSTKSDSILASLTDEDFDCGLKAVRSEAAVAAVRAVVEPIDFLVFGKD